MRKYFKKSPTIFTALCCCVTLAVAFVIPMWDVWILDGIKGNVIEAMEFFPNELNDFWKFQGDNVIRLGIVAAIGAGIGRWLHWRIWVKKYD